MNPQWSIDINLNEANENPQHIFWDIVYNWPAFIFRLDWHKGNVFSKCAVDLAGLMFNKILHDAYSVAVVAVIIMFCSDGISTGSADGLTPWGDRHVL